MNPSQASPSGNVPPESPVVAAPATQTEDTSVDGVTSQVANNVSVDVSTTSQLNEHCLNTYTLLSADLRRDSTCQRHRPCSRRLPLRYGMGRAYLVSLSHASLSDLHVTLPGRVQRGPCARRSSRIQLREMPNLCPSVNWEVRSTASRSISPRLTSHVTQDPASDAVSSTEQSSTLPEYSSVVDWDVRMTVESQWFSFELVFSFRLW